MQDDRLYILPTEEGSTVVVYKDENQPSVLMWPLEQEKEVSNHEVEAYFNNFQEISRLKVSLFAEMCRSLPPWALVKYDWLHQLIKASMNSSLFHPNKTLTGPETLILHWLFFSMVEPKISIIPKSCHEEMLEGTGMLELSPTLAFQIETLEPFPIGEVDYGYLPVQPQDVFSLIYIFPEAAKGCSFTKSLEAAVATCSQNFHIIGQTDCRYKLVLMVRCARSPGIERVDEAGDRSAERPNGYYRITDSKNIGPVALLLFKVTASEIRDQHQTISSGNYWQKYKNIFRIVFILVLGHTLYKLKLLKLN